MSRDIGPVLAAGRLRASRAWGLLFSSQTEHPLAPLARAHGGVLADLAIERGIAFSTHGVITDGAPKREPLPRAPRGARPNRFGHLEREQHERWHPANVAARAHERERAARVWEAAAWERGESWGIDPAEARAPRPGVVSSLEREITEREARGESAQTLRDALDAVRREREVAALFGRASALRGCQSGVVACDADGEIVRGKRGAPLRKVAHCDRRECPDCARRRERATRRRAQRVLEESGVDAGCLVHATLTMRDVAGRGLGESLDALDASLVALRKSAWWQRHVFAALVRLEWTRSTRRTRERHAMTQERRADDAAAVGDVAAASDARRRAEAIRQRRDAGAWYHAHAHVLIIPRVAAGQDGPAMACEAALERVARGGRPRAQPARVCVRELSSAWQACVAAASQEGGQAWIAPWSPRRDLLQELVKYLAKPADMRSLRDAELREALFALDRRRMMRGWGAWREMAKDLSARELAAVEEADDESAGEAEAKAAIERAPDRIAGWRYVRGKQRAIAARNVVWRDDEPAMRKCLDVLWERERAKRAARKGPPLAGAEIKSRMSPGRKVDPPPCRTYIVSRRA